VRIEEPSAGRADSRGGERIGKCGRGMEHEKKEERKERRRGKVGKR